MCWIKHAHICLPSTHSSQRGVATLICHAPRPSFITSALIQHTSNVISLQLEIHQARGAFNCLVGAALPKPSPFSPSLLLWVSPCSEAFFCQGAALAAPAWRLSISHRRPKLLIDRIWRIIQSCFSLFWCLMNLDDTDVDVVMPLQ